MKKQFSAQDTPKIALALGLVLALCGAGWLGAQRMNAGAEEDRTAQQMERESELPDTNYVPAASSTSGQDSDDPEKRLLTSR